MNSQPKPRSPITGSDNVDLLREISSAFIVEKYWNDYETDVSSYFLNTPIVQIYRCHDTDFRFYFPFTLEGKPELYRQLGRHDWFYRSDKWEYRAALNRLAGVRSVLDIGCGTGEFLQQARDKGLLTAGIETSNSAAQEARKTGLDVCVDDVSDFAERHEKEFDAVVAFQVLEHITDVRGFLNSCLKILKPGGLVIFGVPNNDSFLKYHQEAVLNSPPHHMGLWTKSSFEALPRFFDLDLETVEFEPLQADNIGWYKSVMERRYVPPNRFERFLYYRSGASRIFGQFLEENAETIMGHTMMSVFRKRRLTSE